MPKTKDAAPQSSFAALPNEILSIILESLPTTHLLPLLEVSARFHDTVSALLLRRLREALSPPSADLILECFDDHDRLSAPSLSCRYIETTASERYPTHTPEPLCPEGSPLWWHTWFSITRRGGESRCPRPRHTTPATPEEEPAAEDVQTKDVTIEEGAGDVSLTFRALIETEGPAALPTLLVVWEQVLAVSRAWFSRAAAATDEAREGGDCSDDARILWLGAERNCGVRVSVRPLGGEAPLLVGVEEQPAVSYRMEYDALIMRSMLPLIAMDRTFLETFGVEEGALAVVPVPH